jgi:hypothetical protein
MKGIKVLLCFILAMALSAPMVAHAKFKVYHQKSSALYRGRLRNLYNKKVHYVKVPKKYDHVVDVSKKHQIKAVKGKKVTFTTRYILPLPGKDGQRWGNPQSIAMTHKKYMYIVYCPTKFKNRGRIVRFDTKKMDSMGVRLHPAELRDVYVKHHHKYSRLQKKLQRAIKVGPLFITGHGQSLAYNWKNHGLYMWRDKEKAPRIPINYWGYIQHINAKTLRPDHAIRFSLRSHGMRVPGGHNLTFDHAGNAYFWTFPGWGAYIFKGKIHKRSVKFRLTHQVLKRVPGTRIQSIGYNPVRKRLLLLSDASIASFPAKGLRGRGHLTNRSFEWSRFGPKREFEGIAYDGTSRGNLLVNHCPEVLQANRAY